MKTVTVAAIQTHPVFGQVEENLGTALDILPEDCDLAVLPELFRAPPSPSRPLNSDGPCRR